MFEGVEGGWWDGVLPVEVGEFGGFLSVVAQVPLLVGFCIFCGRKEYRLLDVGEPRFELLEVGRQLRGGLALLQLKELVKGH